MALALPSLGRLPPRPLGKGLTHGRDGGARIGLNVRTKCYFGGALSTVGCGGSFEGLWKRILR